ncbi:MAG: putative Histidine kinase [Candidatus Saccharibacteria bacterium]|nr:putative Histidine kinase [Candidatus Saccharibacteria bacterium]
MSTASHGEYKEESRSFVDDSSLIIAAANELSSPLVLLRQLGLTVTSDTLGKDERQLLGEQLTLTSERALRMAASLSMASSGQQRLELEPINPISICREVVHELSPLFAAHGQTLTVQKRSRIPLLVGNRRLLQQILLSFSDNALFYGSKSHPIRMNISGHGDTVRIGVRDYGPAVPIDVWQQIESRVTRHVPTPLASRPHISTVGLIAAQRLAEAMGSAVGVTRHRDGATFYVDLRLSGQTSLL